MKVGKVILTSVGLISLVCFLAVFIEAISYTYHPKMVNCVAESPAPNLYIYYANPDHHKKMYCGSIYLDARKGWTAVAVNDPDAQPYFNDSAPAVEYLTSKYCKMLGS